MAVTKTLIKSKSTPGLKPSQVLSQVNDDLVLDNKTSMFATLFVGILNIRTGELVYTNAGHNTNTSLEAEGQLNTLLEQGAQKILVNFEKLDYISSAGLRVLLATTKQLRSAGGDLRICCPNKMVQEVFDISRFSTIFSVFGAEPEALADF